MSVVTITMRLMRMRKLSVVTARVASLLGSTVDCGQLAVLSEWPAWTLFAFSFFLNQMFHLNNLPEVQSEFQRTASNRMEGTLGLGLNRIKNSAYWIFWGSLCEKRRA